MFANVVSPPRGGPRPAWNTYERGLCVRIYLCFFNSAGALLARQRFIRLDDAHWGSAIGHSGTAYAESPVQNGIRINRAGREWVVSV
jgi:hypothetical protein